MDKVKQIREVAIKVQSLCIANTEITVYYDFKSNLIFTCYNIVYKDSLIICKFKSKDKLDLDYIIEEINLYFNMQLPSWTNYYSNKNAEFQ